MASFPVLVGSLAFLVRSLAGRPSLAAGRVGVRLRERGVRGARALHARLPQGRARPRAGPRDAGDRRHPRGRVHRDGAGGEVARPARSHHPRHLPRRLSVRWARGGVPDVRGVLDPARCGPRAGAHRGRPQPSRSRARAPPRAHAGGARHAGARGERSESPRARGARAGRDHLVRRGRAGAHREPAHVADVRGAGCGATSRPAGQHPRLRAQAPAGQAAARPARPRERRAAVGRDPVHARLGRPSDAAALHRDAAARRDGRDVGRARALGGRHRAQRARAPPAPGAEDGGRGPARRRDRPRAEHADGVRAQQPPRAPRGLERPARGDPQGSREREDGGPPGRGRGADRRVARGRRAHDRDRARHARVRALRERDARAHRLESTSSRPACASPRRSAPA